MTEKPDFIRNFKKPAHTEIKHIGQQWYLYECFSKYDPEVKRSRKISGKCLGKITQEGLVVSTRRMIKTSKPIISDTVEVGGCLYYWDRTTQLRLRLQKYFPDHWQLLYTIALLRATKGPRFKRLQLHYENSLLSHIYPDLTFTSPAISEFLKVLGKQRKAMTAFMHEDVQSDSQYILFDGHRLITASQTMELAELGYDSKRRFKPQTNLLYIYSLQKDMSTPVYYKQYAGSTPDVSAFTDILRESGLKGSDYTVIADKGFAGAEGFDLLNEYGLNHIIPLKRGNKIVKDHLPSSAAGYQDLFVYHGRAIHSLRIEQNAFNVFLYFDAQLYADELADATARQVKKNEILEHKKQAEENRRYKGKGRLSDEELAALKPIELSLLHDQIPEMGTFSIRTNRKDLNSQQVYRLYKQRQEIEQFFKTYGDSMEFEASYMRNTVCQEAWLFLNHLSSKIGVSSIEEIATLEESKNISLEDLHQTLAKITASRVINEWQVSPIKKATQKLLDKLNTTMTQDQIVEMIATDVTT